MEPPSFLAAAWNFIKDPDNQKVLGWLGGGIAAAATAIWAVIKFFASGKKDGDKPSGANVTHSGQGPPRAATRG